MVTRVQYPGQEPPALLTAFRMPDPSLILERVRNEAFYLDYDPMVIFLVENQLFQVHRHFFIQGSKLFQDMFSLKAGDKNATEGASDAHPIVLPNVTVKEFQALLRFLYAMTPTEVLRFEMEEKLALLSIAHQFTFDEIFEYVLQQIDPAKIPVVDKIRLADKCGLPEWFSTAYQTILKRTPEDKITEDEAVALGLGRLLKLYEEKNLMYHKAQEALRGRRSIL